MSSQAVMKRQILALAKREPSNEELQKIKQSLAVFKKLTKEEQSKINEMVNDAHAKLESEGKFAKGGKTKTQSLKTALTDLKNKVGVKRFKRATTGTDIKKDIAIPALKGGKRIVRTKGKTTNQYGTFKNQVGTTYYENRANRSDVNQPSQTRKIKLADGGNIDKNIRFDVDFYDDNNTRKETSVELILRGSSLDNVIKDAIKKAYELKKNYIEFYNRNSFLGSINLATSSDFREGRDFREGKIKLADGGTTTNLSSVKRKYYKNEDENAHSENVVLLAKHFGDAEDLKLAKQILAKHNKEGHLSSENGKQRNDLHLKLIEKARVKFGEEGIEFAKGGEIGNVDYNEILPILKDKLEDAITELPNKYETSYTFNGEEVESKSRDGFIAYTDGGYEVRWFEQISYFSGSGNNLPTKALDNEMQRQVDYNYEYAKDRFKDEYSEIVEELGEENIDYNSLYEAGYESEAEQLSEWENDYDSDDTIMCEIGAYYYSPDNSRGIEDKHTIRLFGLVNLESPYHRSGNLEDRFDIDITFNSIAEMEEKLEKGLKEIIDWFDGSKYSESTKELKIVRMAKGGQLKSKAKYIPNRNIDEIEVTRNGKTTSIDGANLLDGVYVKKGTKFAKGGEVGRFKVGVFNEAQLRNQEDKKAVEKAQKETGLTYVDSKIIKKGGKMFLEVYLIPTDEYLSSNKFAKGGELKSKAKYIPNRNIDEIEVTRNGKTTSIDGANLLDGVYVKKGTRYAKGGMMNANEHFRLRGFEFLNDDLATLQEAIQENNQEEIQKFFSYWGQHLEMLKTNNNERMFYFLQEDLMKLQNDIEEKNQEEIDKFFSYWEYHLQSLKYAQGGTIKKSLAEFKNKVGASKYREATRGVDIKADLQVPALKKGRRVVTTKGKTSNQYGTFKNKVGSVYYENRPNHYDVNQPSAKRKIKLAHGGKVGSSLTQKVKHINEKYDGVVATKTERDNRIQVKSPFFNTLNEIKRNEFDGNGLLQRDRNSSAYILYSNAIFAQGGTFADGGVLEGAEIYVADLAEYNNGRLVGKHLKLSDYSSGAEVMEAIQAILDEQTAKDKYGEVHEEYAIHDFEGFPRSFYHESMGENDFDKLYEIAEVANDRGIPIDVLMEAVSDFGADEDVERVAEAYYSSVRPSFGGEFKSFAMDMVDELGIEGINNVEYYFDFDSFGSDARTDYTDEELEEYGYDDLDDTELGERLVDDMGGFDQLGKETIEGYFDYDKFGDALEYDFISVKGDDGDYYFFNRNW
jgi:antirestriction protein